MGIDRKSESYENRARSASPIFKDCVGFGVVKVIMRIEVDYMGVKCN